MVNLNDMLIDICFRDWPVEIVQIVLNYTALLDLFLFGRDKFILVSSTVNCHLCGFTVSVSQTSLPLPPTHSDFAASIRIRDTIYVTGGQITLRMWNSEYDNPIPLVSSKMYCFDISTRRWSTGPSMKFPRSHHSVAILPADENCFIVLGGWDGTATMDSCEIYNTVTKIWIPAASLLQTRMSSQTAVLDGLIYVFSGFWVSPDDWKFRCLTCKPTLSSLRSPSNSSMTCDNRRNV